MTEAIAAYGTTLQWNAQPLAELTSISGPSISIDTIDVTHYGSASGFKEFIAGFGDGGEVTLEGNFLPGDTDGQYAFKVDAFAKAVREVIITFPAAAATTWTFNGLVTSLDFDEAKEEQLKFSATIKISGVPALAITASTGMATLTGKEQTLEAALVFVPAFAIGTFTYTVTVDTASDWVTLTPTADSHTITITCGTQIQTVTSTYESTSIILGLAGTTTTITVKVQQSGKVAKTYTLYISRPLP